MSAYVDDSIFSIDLVGAVSPVANYFSTIAELLFLLFQVLRQGSFVQKMHGLRWTVPSYFNSKEDEVVLQHCTARYHAYVLINCNYDTIPRLTIFHSFLDLMASSPASFFVPTLDIDLAWHSHQLSAKQYESDCATYVQRYIDQ